MATSGVSLSSSRRISPKSNWLSAGVKAIKSFVAAAKPAFS